MNFNLTVFLVGFAGGVVAELLKWYQLRTSTNWPVYLHSLGYWIITVLMAAAGGFLALIQGVDESKLLLALNIGISAPLILKGLASAVPITPPSTADGKPALNTLTATPSLVNFIAGR